MNVKIGAKIKDLRKRRDITQEQLADALGVTNQAISKWESENGYPDIEYISQIADFFNVTIDYLFNRVHQQGRAKILIVDDAKMREAYSGILRSEYEIVFVDLWQDIVEYAMNEKPDLILMDIATSGIKNFGSLVALKDSKVTRDIPVFIVSEWCIAHGKANDQFELHVGDCIKLGATDYVVKPFSPYVLKAKIAATLLNPKGKGHSIHEEFKFFKSDYNVPID